VLCEEAEAEKMITVFGLLVISLFGSVSLGLQKMWEVSRENEKQDKAIAETARRVCRPIFEKAWKNGQREKNG
jgi:hypothetical protein